MIDPVTDTLARCATGIDGLDQITGGGFPAGRPVLVCGGPGCGKTLLALQFAARGAAQFGENALVVTFEETAQELVENARSIGCDLASLIGQDRLRIDMIDLAGARMSEAGDFDLDGLFLRLEAGVAAVGAKRVVIDSIEALFARFARADVVRAELQRLNRWLKTHGVTALITGESAGPELTRYGIEEFLCDSVIRLDHRSHEQVATRRLRVIKLRGSAHGTNEYPFLIGEDGLAVLPVTGLALDYPVSEERVASGIARLDEMLGGAGFFRGSTVLVSGTSGTGKSSLAATFVAAACARGERALYLPFEEAPRQIVRNMRSIGIDLARHLDAGLLRIEAERATSSGLETHLSRIIHLIQTWKPTVVAIDPVSNLTSAAPERDVKSVLTRLVDFLKASGVTVLFTDLSRAGESPEGTSTEISSLMDTWILLRDIEIGGERNRGLYVLKSRGMAHSNQIRELRIDARGIDLIEVYTGPEGVLTGTARVVLEAREAAEAEARGRTLARLQTELEERRRRHARDREDLDRALAQDLDALEQAISESREGIDSRARMTSRLARMRGDRHP